MKGEGALNVQSRVSFTIRVWGLRFSGFGFRGRGVEELRQHS